MFNQISFSAHKGKCLISIIAWPNALISEVDFFSGCGFDSPRVNYRLNIFQASHHIKVVRKEKNLVFNESKIFSHIKLYQLQSTGINNFPEAVNKDIICDYLLKQ